MLKANMQQHISMMKGSWRAVYDRVNCAACQKRFLCGILDGKLLLPRCIGEDGAWTAPQDPDQEWS